MLLRCRIEKDLLERADRVTQRLGSSTHEMIRIFIAQIAHTGKVPLQLSAEEDALSPWEQRAATLEGFYDPAKTW